MSEIPALDPLVQMKDEFEGKSEDEILDIIAERTAKMPVDMYNELPFHSDFTFTEVGQLAKLKKDIKKEGDFVAVIGLSDIDESNEHTMSIRMLLLVG